MEVRLAVLTLIILSEVSWTWSRSIQKRSVFQLCDLVTFHTHRSCMTVNDYGCFCGLGQNGANPLDNIDRLNWSDYGDVLGPPLISIYFVYYLVHATHYYVQDSMQCCYEHDLCYGELPMCFWYIPQMMYYWYRCNPDTGTCSCINNWPCTQTICECDLQFARCLQNAFSNTVYSNGYKNYNISRCV